MVVSSVRLHLDAVIPRRDLPHDYVSEIFQRKKHIPKMFRSVKCCRLQKDNSPDHREFIGKRLIYFSLKACAWLPCSFEMHPPVAMVSSASCTFVLYLSFLNISFV